MDENMKAMTKKEIEDFFFCLEAWVGLKGDKFDLRADIILIEVDDLSLSMDILKALDQIIALTKGNGY